MAAPVALLVMVMLFLCNVQHFCSSRLIAPPPGNSVAITAIALDGELEYICKQDGGSWLLVHVRATLLDRINQTKVVGFYTRNYASSSSSRHAGTWTFINSKGDEAESGHATSLVSGNLLVSTKSREDRLVDFLAQASVHQYEGTARTISYIAQMNATLKGRQLLPYCNARNSKVNLQFKADYMFWKQDVLPPKVPHSLVVPNQHQVVESFFAQGVVRFYYDQKMQSWSQRRVLAKLYDVPGGIHLGGFSFNISSKVQYTNTSHRQYQNNFACILIDNPNGFTICGRQEALASMSANRQSLPWSLFRVTSNQGYMTTILGPFSYVQMVSTWGGLPPQTSNDTSSTAPIHGRNSFFTAIFWLYKQKVT